MVMNLSLLLDLYELTMAESYRVYKRDTFATFDLFVRQMPVNRSYLVACGLDTVLKYLREFKFSGSDLGFLKSIKLFSPDFLRFLKDFRFSLDIWAMPEGTVFFPQEPVIRVTGPIIEAQILESFFLNAVNLETMIASKASRVVTASQGRRLYDFALRRTHGVDAAVKVARSAYLSGFTGTSNCLAAKNYGIPLAGTMAHSFVMSFKNELDSFKAYSSVFPDRAILLVDTYNTVKGIENAIAIGLQLKDRGHKLLGIRLDSGDLLKLSRAARAMLDKAGLDFVKIFASGNLDEFKIASLLKKGACIDSFGVGTNMGTSIDAPCLDVIYKICEAGESSGNFLPTMKLSLAKVTYPGRKQVFRLQDKKGGYIKDVLGLEKENIKGKPLLKKVVENGRQVYKVPSLDDSKKFLQQELSRFPDRLKGVSRRYHYPVIISPGLKSLRRDLSRQLSGRQ